MDKLTQPQNLTVAGVALLVIVCVLEGTGWILPERMESLWQIGLGAIGGGAIVAKGLR